jgi:hypothetical protein
MNYSLPLLFSAIFISPVTDFSAPVEKQAVAIRAASTEPEVLTLQNQAEGRMTAIGFKSQEFCRAELKDFEFDVRFSVVSATVYFSGAGFNGVEKGTINSSSLKPVARLKDKCKPGSVVVFDDVKVKGPDNEIRSIDGVTYILY